LRVLLTGNRTFVVVQNDYDLAFVVNNKIGKRENVLLIPGSGINVNDFSPVTRKQKRAKIKVLMASRILIDKGVREYFSAAQAICEKRDDVEFLLAGEPDPGNPSSIEDKEIASWNQVAGFSVLGYVEDMRQLLRAVDIFVLPSYREGLPKSLLEAAACGLPIVTTDVPGCNDVVVQNSNGLLVPPRQVVPLTEAIDELVKCPNLREDFGRLGRQRVADLFNEERVLAKTTEIYSNFAKSET
jgi:glycosyltransferase involved in cell wall biosynthesis